MTTAMRARTRVLAGRAIRWDGSNAGELAGLAGDRFEGVYVSAALVRNGDGELVHVRPGWVVAVWDGVEGVGIFSAGAWETLAEEAG